jgi:hypothetical protein
MVDGVPIVRPGTIVSASMDTIETHSLVLTSSHHRLSKYIVMHMVTLGTGVAFYDRYVYQQSFGWIRENILDGMSPSWIDSDWVAVE